MKQLSGLFILVLLSGMMSFGQTNQKSQKELITKNADSTEIKKLILLEDQYRQAKLNHNAEVLDKIIADNFSKINEDGTSDNKTKFKIDLLNSPVGNFKLDSLSVTVNDTLAIVKGLVISDSSLYSYKRTYIKQKGQWRLFKSAPVKLEILNIHLTDASIKEVPVTNEVIANRLVREGHNFSLRQIPILEEQLKRNPENISARVRLLGYYFNSAIKDLGPEATHAARRRHILWLIQNHPENIANKLSETTIDSSGHALADAEGYIQAKKLWLEQIELQKTNPQVLVNAAWYFKLNNKAVAINCLKQAVQLAPKVREIASQLGYVYAITVLGITMINNNGLPMGQNPAEARNAVALSAIKDLQTSTNIDVIGVAARVISQYGNIIRSIFKDAVNLDELNEELLIRATKIVSQNLTPIQSLIEFYSEHALRSITPEERTIFANKGLAQAEIFISITKDHNDWNLLALYTALKFSMNIRSLDNAKRYATELIKKIPDLQALKYGPVFHDVYIALGRAALKDGNVEQAKMQLLKAGHTTGGGTLNLSGPNLTLAKELSDHGERETVIAYLELCKSFMGYNNSVNTWIQTLKEGKTPDFGDNLVY